MSSFIIGTAVRLSAAFTNEAGIPTDPDTVQFKVKPPGEELVTYEYDTDPEVVRDEVGEFHLIVVLDEAGTWKYYVKGTGAVQIAAKSAFRCWGELA